MKTIRKLVALIVIPAIIGMIGAPPANAAWHRKDLPFGGSGGIAAVAVVGTVGVVLLVHAISKHRQARDPVHVTPAVHFGPGSGPVSSFKVENTNPSPVQLAELKVPSGFELVDSPALPLVVRAHESLNLQLRASGARRKGSLQVSILQGRKTTTRLIALRVGARQPQKRSDSE